MYSFVKSLKKADHIRRYSIHSTESGWEIREEEDAQLVRHTYYQDWQRVERAKLAMSVTWNSLREQGWSEL